MQCETNHKLILVQVVVIVFRIMISCPCSVKLYRVSLINTNRAHSLTFLWILVLSHCCKLQVLRDSILTL